jgi:hypothetical protein
MQAAVLEPVVDSSLEQWLRRVISDPIRPGVVDLSERPQARDGRPVGVLARVGRRTRPVFGRSYRHSGSGMSLEEIVQLRLALQSNRSVKVLKIPFDNSSRSKLLDGLRQLAGALGELTALEHLTIVTQSNETMSMVIIAF